MFVHLAVERAGGVAPLPELEDAPSAGMHRHEVVHLVHHAVDHDQLLPLRHALADRVPVHGRQRANVMPPVNGLLELVQLLLLDLHLSLSDFVIRETNQSRTQTKVRQSAHNPLGRVVVVPPNAVAVVVRKLVMVVVVALAKRDQRRDDVVVAGVLLGVGLHAKRVRQAVDAERGLVHKEHAPKAGVHQRAPKIVPAQGSHRQRKNEPKQQRNGQVVAVLEHDAAMGVEVADVDAPRPSRVLLEHHPANVRVPEALVHGVRILVGIDVAMVRAVVAAPPSRRSLERGGAPRQQHKLHRPRGVVRLVRPQAVVAGGDAGAGEDVLHDGQDERRATQRHEPHAQQQPDERREDDGGGQPVNSLQERQLAELLVGHVLGALGLLQVRALALIVLELGLWRSRRHGHVARRVHRDAWGGGGGGGRGRGEGEGGRGRGRGKRGPGRGEGSGLGGGGKSEGAQVGSGPRRAFIGEQRTSGERDGTNAQKQIWRRTHSTSYGAWRGAPGATARAIAQRHTHVPPPPPPPPPPRARAPRPRPRAAPLRAPRPRALHHRRRRLGGHERARLGNVQQPHLRLGQRRLHERRVGERAEKVHRKVGLLLGELVDGVDHLVVKVVHHHHGHAPELLGHEAVAVDAGKHNADEVLGVRLDAAHNGVQVEADALGQRAHGAVVREQAQDGERVADVDVEELADLGPRRRDLLGGGHVILDGGGQVSQHHNVGHKRVAAGDLVLTLRPAGRAQQLGRLLHGRLLHVGAEAAHERGQVADHADGQHDPLHVGRAQVAEQVAPVVLGQVVGEGGHVERHLHHGRLARRERARAHQRVAVQPAAQRKVARVQRAVRALRTSRRVVGGQPDQIGRRGHAPHEERHVDAVGDDEVVRGERRRENLHHAVAVGHHANERLDQHEQHVIAVVHVVQRHGVRRQNIHDGTRGVLRLGGGGHGVDGLDGGDVCRRRATTNWPTLRQSAAATCPKWACSAAAAASYGAAHWTRTRATHPTDAASVTWRRGRGWGGWHAGKQAKQRQGGATGGDGDDGARQCARARRAGRRGRGGGGGKGGRRRRGWVDLRLGRKRAATLRRRRTRAHASAHSIHEPWSAPRATRYSAAARAPRPKKRARCNRAKTRARSRGAAAAAAARGGARRRLRRRRLRRRRRRRPTAEAAGAAAAGAAATAETAEGAAGRAARCAARELSRRARVR
ncbi:stearoyl-CoA desaturase Delta-9 fatty acid desaturase [Gracilaria domingensis]|nr:stearoyl-CoA desaturase Delta-9 fatty acid desaturase [Gracilaria domingensis]